MVIHGFQKLTMLDFPGKTACTVFTGGCNLRCPFCHNADLVLDPWKYHSVPAAEVFEYLEKRKGLLDGVCITGGEPMLMKDLPDFAARIKEMGFLVKLDTNGTYPKQLKYMVSNGLTDYVAMDIKNTPEKYPSTCGKTELDIAPVLESVEFLKSGAVDHEFRTTVCKTFHTESDLVGIAKWLGHDQKYFLQAFKDSGELMTQGIEGYTPDELRAILRAVKKVIPACEVRGI